MKKYRDFFISLSAILNNNDDGRFATLLDVVNHYNDHFNLGLTPQEKSDIVEYLKSL